MMRIVSPSRATRGRGRASALDCASPLALL